MRHPTLIYNEANVEAFDGRYENIRPFLRERIRGLPDRLAQLNLARDAAIKAVSVDLWDPRYKSITENPRFLEMLGNVDPDRSGLIAHMIWATAALQRTRRYYRVTPGLAERLRHTELRGIRARNLRLPYPAIYVEIPESLGLRVHNVSSGWHSVIGCYVVEEPEPRSWWLMVWGKPHGWLLPGCPDDALLYWRMQLTDDDWSVTDIIDNARTTNTSDRIPCNRRAEFDVQPWVDIFRWIMNLVTYVTHPGARLTAEPQSQKAWNKYQGSRGTRRKTAQALWRKLGHTVVVGQGVGALGAPLQFRTLVTGHWRQVACGPGLQDHRIRWIEPYWRGPEDAAISTTEHRV